MEPATLKHICLKHFQAQEYKNKGHSHTSEEEVVVPEHEDKTGGFWQSRACSVKENAFALGSLKIMNF